ncbi:probable G-protein coupled receptor Mth-like 9 [Adelges cooleyi]|uniref:probable G-protein coupled receptor Mth-like 9 n=1 Tax=Adelges cooleyi TaxID=133065 RepID=UPI00217FF3A0|nr:probable G-protein coupled receptor Mth-like 9 [Adelges cooleyi]
MARTYVTTVWIVAWTLSLTMCSVDDKVTKCCPRDMILRADLATCTGYDTEAQSARESYEWSSDTDSGMTTGSPEEELSLSILNNTVPWWIPGNMDFLKADNFSQVVIPDSGLFDSEGRLPCDINDREVRPLDNDVSLLDNGQLVVFWQGNKIVFASSEYCVDRVSLMDNFTLPPTTGNGDKKKKPVRRAATISGWALYSYVALLCQTCSKTMCVPKCCGKGLVLEYKKHAISGCRRTNTTATVHLKDVNGSVLNSSDFYFSPMRPPDCENRGSYLLNNPDNSKHTDYRVLPDGRVQVQNGLEYIERDEYCVDVVMVDGKPFSESILACRLQGGASASGAAAPLEFREILYGTYFVVGAMFLAATLLIYAVLPELRVTVHSGNLIAHTVCLFVSYTTLAATTLTTQLFNKYACVIAAFVIQFSFLAAFFWLNVMCADIAWTFSGFRLLSYSNKIENEKKKYMIYSVYAWGSSIIISVLTAVAEFTDFLVSPEYKPNFGQRDCWFANKLSVGLFFYAPIGILLLTNFILFMFTALRIVFIRRVTSKVLNRQTNQNNTRLALYAKLFCLMGVTFVFEVISWAVQGPAYYWYVTDALNSLRGVFVFFIFCWKRSVLDLLLARVPDRVRTRLVRLFGIRDSRRHPSFSSVYQFPAATRTRSSSASAQQITSGSSFQLSQFGSSASMARKANSRHKP